MADEPDGVDDAIRDRMRVALTVAVRGAEALSRATERAARDRQTAAEQQTRGLRERFDAQRTAAVAALDPVRQNGWWDRASPAHVADAWQTAHAWRAHDPRADAAAQRIREQVQRRYGVDVDQLQADRTTVTGAVAERAPNEAQAQETPACAAVDERRRDEAGVALLGVSARQEARQLEEDSARAGGAVVAAGRASEPRGGRDGGRRGGARGDAEAVRAKALADVGNAKPAAEATRGAAVGAVKVQRQRTAVSRDPQRQLSR